MSWADGARPSLRWVMNHVIEEEARHNGHADLLRELVDGAVGDCAVSTVRRPRLRVSDASWEPTAVGIPTTSLYWLGRPRLGS